METKLTKKVHMDGTKAMFKQSVKGGKLPDNFEVYIDTTIDFEGSQLPDLYACCAGGSSARVQLQAQLRQCSVDELNGYAKNGLTVTFNKIIAGTAKPVPKPIDLLMALSLEDFIKWAEVNMDMDADHATLVFYKKHPELSENPNE